MDIVSGSDESRVREILATVKPLAMEVSILLRLIVFCFALVPMLCSAQAANTNPDEWPFQHAKSLSGNEQIVALENFLRDYPDSFHKEESLEALIDRYEEAADQDKTRRTAQRLLDVNSNNLKAKTALNYTVINAGGLPEIKSEPEGKTKIPPDQPPPGNLLKNGESDHTTIVTAVIAAFAAILAAYWQFVYKPRQSSVASSQREGANSRNSVFQAPVINVSPSFNVSPGNTDLDIKLKEQLLRQNEIAAETNSCRQLILIMVNETKKKHGQNSLAFTEDQLREWAGAYSQRLHAVLDALRTEGRARSLSPGHWVID